MVSDMGNVLSLNYKHKKTPHKMSLSASSTGYLHVQLYKNKKPYTKTVHSLVAEAFIPNPESKTEINHIDGDKTNNRVSNLEWNTRSENQLHSIKHGLRKSSPNLGRFGKNNACSKRIIQCDLSGNPIREWDSISDAARYYGIRSSTISTCLTGRRPTMHGFVWKYSDSI